MCARDKVRSKHISKKKREVRLKQLNEKVYKQMTMTEATCPKRQACKLANKGFERRKLKLGMSR